MSDVYLLGMDENKKGGSLGVFLLTRRSYVIYIDFGEFPAILLK
jgi:hypothetical protein